MRPRLLASLAVVGSLSPLPALSDPTNDTCVEAKVLAFPAEVVDSTADVTVDSLEPACGKNDPFASWFRFTAPEAGRYEARTKDAGGLKDTTVAFFSSCGGDVLGCEDDPLTSLFATPYVDLGAGQEVFVRVAGWGRTRGAFGLQLAHPADLARPPNDACDDAISLTAGIEAPGDTLNAVGVDTSSCGDSDTSDIWYAFTAPSDADYTFFLTQNMLSANLVSIQTGCGTGELACGLGSATTHLTAGQAVKVRIGTNPNAADRFNVNVTPAPAIPPVANDSWTGAISVTAPSTTPGTTVGATEDALSFGPSCGPFVNDAVWYSFTAPAAGSYVFDTNGSEMVDTALAVFDACGSNGAGPPALFGCDDDGGAGRWSRMEGTMPAGASVCIAVAGHYLSEHGKITLNVSPSPKPPVNEHCDGALPIALDEVVKAENFSSTPEVVDAACPTGEFALWYTFTAPVDADYKFDTKHSVESSPGIAVFAESQTDACAGALVACSEDPLPAVSHALKAGEKVWIRLGTNVFLRGELALHVGPTPTAEPTGAGGGSTTSSSTSSTTASTSATGGGGGEAPTPDGGCDCGVSVGASPTTSDGGGAAAVALAMGLALRRRRRKR